MTLQIAQFLLENKATKLICFLLLLCLTPLLFINDPFVYSERYIRSLWDLGHVPFFVVATIFLMQLFQPKNIFQNTALLIFVFFSSVGIEWLQSLIGRDASWGDVGANIAGTLIALFWLNRATFFIWIGRFGTILVIVFLLSKPALYFVEYLQLRSELPVLATFEDEREMRRWSRRLLRSSEHASEGQFSGKFLLNEESFRGFGLFRIARNWTPYARLSIDIFNPTIHNIEINLRIEDVFIRKQWRYNNAFNETLLLRPGWQTVNVNLKDVENGPENRKLDLQNVYSIRMTPLNLGELDSSSDNALFIDNLKLQQTVQLSHNATD